MTVSGFIREARKGRGISTRELAELSGVSRTTIQNMERGTHSPNIDTFVRLVKALGSKIVILPKEARP